MSYPFEESVQESVSELESQLDSQESNIESDDARKSSRVDAFGDIVEFADTNDDDIDDESDDDSDNDLMDDEVVDEGEVSGPLFSDFAIGKDLLNSLTAMGYSKPTPIQSACVPVLLEGDNDVVALARTGTGKTAAFGIPLIERLDTQKKTIQALVLCPTRELCLQVTKALTEMGTGKRVKVLSIYGGDSYTRQRDGLARGPHIVVATPGRLIDLLDQKQVPLQKVQTVVLDEADEMISVGFKEALDQILSTLEGKEHRTWMFSATMSREVKRVQEAFLPDAKLIDARGGEEKPLIRQQYMFTFEEDRFEALKRYLLVNPEFYGLIFCQTKAEVVALEEELKRDGYKVASLHGDKVQRDRELVFAAWKKKTVSIVIATDVAARGLDVKGLTHVVNMSLSREFETYVHRIGRTGRAGLEGIALTFIWPKRLPLLRQLEQRIGEKLQWVPVPDAKEVSRAILTKQLADVFTSKLQFDEENPIHTAIIDLIEKSPMGEGFPEKEYLPLIAALCARFVWKNSAGAIERPFVKMLNPETQKRQSGGPMSGGPRGGHSGQRPSGRHPYHGRRDRDYGAPRFGARRDAGPARGESSDRFGGRPSSAHHSASNQGGLGRPSGFQSPDRPPVGRPSGRPASRPYGGERDAGPRSARPFSGGAGARVGKSPRKFERDSDSSGGGVGGDKPFRKSRKSTGITKRDDA